MSKLVNIIIAAVLFYIIFFMLVPLLPSPIGGFIGILVVVIAILYCLGEIGGYSWPWSK